MSKVEYVADMNVFKLEDFRDLRPKSVFPESFDRQFPVI